MKNHSESALLKKKKIPISLIITTPMRERERERDHLTQKPDY